MPSYATPGIYIEEVSDGARPISSVGSGTAAFLGEAPNIGAYVHHPKAINNWSQFVREFAGNKTVGTDLARAVFGFFNNGGSRCYVVNLGRGGSLAGDGRTRSGVAALETVEEVKILAAPGYCDPSSYDTLIAHCEKMKNCFAILDSPMEVDDIDRLKKVGMVAAPSKKADKEEKGEATPVSTGLRPPVNGAGRAGFYFPWIKARDPFDPKQIVDTPPSGHLAGVYARTDATRGVYKAPANEPVRGALGLNYHVTHAEQGELNRAGVNCIRYFADTGIVVWGARTLAEDASEWRYINVRRLFNMIEESVAAGTRWVVFEPNDLRTWKSIERDIRAYLTLMWRDGALKGETPEQAFFVKCDAETNPNEVIDAGRLITEIGIAPVKPAEFIVFRIGQWAGGVESEENAEAETETND